MQPKRIWVTGAAGFIGSHLVDRLLDEGNTVVGIDSFHPFYPRWRKERNIEGHLKHPRYTLIELDLSAPQAQATLGELSPPDVIVHLAARAGVRPSIADPIGYQHSNVLATQQLLEVARALRCPQFVFASSSSVYGVSPTLPWSESEPGLRPISPYAATKVAGELLGHVYAHLYEMRFIALRFFTVYGPRQRPDLAIHKFAQLMLNNEPLPVFGDGNSSRDYTFVADTVDGICAAMAYQGSNYEIFNLGNDSRVSLNLLIETLAHALGQTPQLVRLPDQPGDVPHTWADLSKSAKLLGYQPKTAFAQGVEHFVSWLRANPTRTP